MTEFIFLTGRRRSGKDTTAKAIRTMTQGWQLMAFADAMKDMLAEKDGIARWMLDDEVQKEKFRPRMILFAEGERANDPFIFVNKLQDKIKVLKPDAKIIITDLRRPPELEMAKLYMPFGPDNSKGVLLNVWADEKTRTKRGYVYDPVVDESDTEKYMDKPDKFFYALGGAVIHNSDGNCLTGQLRLLKNYFGW